MRRSLMPLDGRRVLVKLTNGQQLAGQFKYLAEMFRVDDYCGYISDIEDIEEFGKPESREYYSKEAFSRIIKLRKKYRG